MAERDELLEATRATYDRLAERFNSFGRENIRAAYRALVPGPRGCRVLDAGCGAGQDSAWLATRGATVVAVDVSPAMVDLARRRSRDGTPFEVRHCDSEETGEDDESFDAVLSSMEIMHHSSLDATIAEYSRLLRVGGSLVLVANHPVRNMLLTPDGSYFREGRCMENWGEWGRVEVQHWPFCRYVASMCSTSLRIDCVLELEAPRDVQRVHDTAVTFRGRFPSFLVISARREQE